MLTVGSKPDSQEFLGDPELEDLPETAQPRAVGTGTMVAAGTVWVMLQTLATKGVMVVGQLILAWLLDPKDFGEIGLAYTVTAFVSLITNPGIDVILVRRGRRFHLWSNPAFYFSLATGLLGCIAILIASPAVAHVYETPQLLGLLAVLALATPIGSLHIVPTAKLRTEMNFRMLSAIALGQSAIQTVLTVLFAAFGVGVYSFVLPVPLAYAAASVVLWGTARPEVRLSDPFRHWRYLIGDSGYIFGQRLLVTIVSQGDYIILGILYGAAIVGPYFFAYGIATQAIRLTAGSLQLVLMAGLARMPAYSSQQTKAALRATKAIALIGMPLCMLQAAIAGPLLRALYGDKWIAAVPLVQLVSVGLAFDVISWPACSLLQSRGQFRFMFFWSCVSATIFVLFVFIGAYYGKAFGAASAVCLFFAMFSPPLGFWTFWTSDISAREIAGIYISPLFVGLISVGATLFTISMTTGLSPLPQFGVAASAGMLAMAAAARLIAPRLWNDILFKLMSAFPSVLLTGK
jgi:O-antigen/teichoic acid export membrane protein